jgi:predicted transposase YdaD
MTHAIERLIETREKEAKQEGMIEVAKNMLKRGKSVEEIVADTGLTHEKVEGLEP